MTASKCEISRCGLCLFYVHEGRRGGMCSQLDVPVGSRWKACSLATSPFQTDTLAAARKHTEEMVASDVRAGINSHLPHGHASRRSASRSRPVPDRVTPNGSPDLKTSVSVAPHQAIAQPRTPQAKITSTKPLSKFVLADKLTQDKANRD